MAVDLPPPAIHAPVPNFVKTQSAQGLNSNKTTQQARRTSATGGNPVSRYFEAYTSPIYLYGKKMKHKHTNRLHSRKKAKFKAKRK